MTSKEELARKVVRDQSHRQLPKKKGRPTIDELEKILDAPDGRYSMQIAPDGSIEARDDEELIAAITAALAQIERETIERCAGVCETLFPPIHTHASENSDRYHVQDEMRFLAAERIRSLLSPTPEKADG